MSTSTRARVEPEQASRGAQPPDVAVVVGAEHVDRRCRTPARACRRGRRRRRRSRGTRRPASESVAGPCRRRTPSSWPRASRLPRTCRSARAPPESEPRRLPAVPTCRGERGSARARPGSAPSSGRLDPPPASRSRRRTRPGSHPRVAPGRLGAPRPTRERGRSGDRRRCSSTPARQCGRRSRAAVPPSRRTRRSAHGRPSAGPVGFADTISTWIRCGVAAEPAPYAAPALEDLRERVREPRVCQMKVDEPRPGDICAVDDVERRRLLGDGVRQVARRASATRPPIRSATFVA